VRRLAILLLLGACGQGAMAPDDADCRRPHALLVEPSYDELVLLDEPVLYWRLDGSSWPVEPDLSGRGHVGSYLGGASPGHGNVVFDGRSGRLETPDASDLSVATTGYLAVEMWLRPDNLVPPDLEGSGYVYFAGKGARGQHEYAARMYSLANSEGRPNRVSGYAFNLSGGKGSGSYFQDPLVAGRWLHYVLTVDTGTGNVDVYRDGVLRDSTPLSQFAVVPADGTAPFRVGTRDGESFLQGAVARVAVFSRPLDPTLLEARAARVPD
jgi:hypothetical protein